MTTDTIETNGTPAGGEGATSSQDTVSQVDTQPVTNEPSVSDGSQEEAGEATLLAGKYKSPEELEKAYKELEGKLGDLGQKASIADLLQEKYKVTPEQLKAQIEAEEIEARRQRYAGNPLAPIVEEVQALKGQLALQNEEKELDKFLAENPDYQPYRDKILKLGLSSEQNKSYEEIAREWFGESRAQGQKDAYKKIETKKSTQVTGVSRQEGKRSLSLEDLSNMSVEELEKVLPHAEPQNRPY